MRSLNARGLHEFVVESNRIEGIEREPTGAEVEAHERFLALSRDEMTVDALQEFVAVVAPGKPLRCRSGLDVRVGGHVPPPGGSQVRIDLEGLLADVAHPYMASDTTSFEAHQEYERLHPFMDGNGRSGRALWAWMMQEQGHDPFSLPFLHRWYYQSLDAVRPATQTREPSERLNQNESVDDPPSDDLRDTGHWAVGENYRR